MMQAETLQKLTEEAIDWCIALETEYELTGDVKVISTLDASPVDLLVDWTVELLAVASEIPSPEAYLHSNLESFVFVVCEHVEEDQLMLLAESFLNLTVA